MDEADSLSAYVREEWLALVERRAMSELYREYTYNIMADSEQRLPRKILLSATLSYHVEELYEWNLHNPKLFLAVTKEQVSRNRQPISDIIQEVADNDSTIIPTVSIPTTVTIKSLVASKNLHPLIVTRQIQQGAFKKVLVFVSVRSVPSTQFIISSTEWLPNVSLSY